jgi:AmmeMemoRadiSam system protein B/AmmeMemoRadiSam system protein A
MSTVMKFILKHRPRAGLTFLALLVLCACKGQKSQGDPTMQQNIPSQDIRRPAVAGSWYSNEAGELRGELEEYLAEAEDFKLGEITGLVSPHAGYAYSGPVAAFSYRQIMGRHYETVVVIAPSHVEAFPYASIYGRGGYQTPLGLIPVDTALAKAIAGNCTKVKISDRGHRQEGLGRQEHSLEIQLPFLQIALGEFKLVPIVMGEQSDSAVSELAEALARVTSGKKVLLVASSDLSHYHSYAEAKRLDAGIQMRIGDYDAQGLWADLNRQKVEACGGGPICAVMEACKKLSADQSKVLRYATSGDVPAGEKDRVVGYVAAAFYRSSGAGKVETGKVNHGDAKPLSAEDKATLLKIARTTIEKVVRGEPVPKFPVDSPDLLEDRGAFVTITEDGNLRGCIGYIIPVKPLYLTVREVAESAALRDPRFNPVKPNELPHLHLEISALSVPRKIKNAEEIQVGVHGIIIRKGYHQGLLLPQVATENGWDRKTFLEYTCRKAGLPLNAWQEEDTEIEIFSAEVFGEQE